MINNLDIGKQDLLKDFTLKSDQPLKQFDTAKLFFGDAKFNRLEYSVTLDSTAKEITLVHKWKENTAYTVILHKDMAVDTAGNSITRTDTINFNSK
ncbi:MAG: hypothetical protein RIQ50_262, partial [Bacteroidota bacterium]